MYVDGFPGAVYKSFGTRGEATTWWVTTHRDRATTTSTAPSNPSKSPMTKRTRPAGSGGEPDLPQGLEPVRPKKVPRQGKQAAGPTAFIEISSSPPSSPDSFVSATEDSDPISKSLAASQDNVSVRTQGFVDDSMTYPAIPAPSGPTVECEDPQTNTYQVQRPIEKPSISLTPEQSVIVQNVLRGDNVFFTGPAGSGKSL
ncbi:hypothetical protein ABW21_db0205068 [Orbilia brochopaga]|nr:hypothetical protein ABW21_db0205068 [Drechslerella brochopaga]